MNCAVTISLVPEARGGPFVFWDDLESGCRTARELGFDAVEVFAPGPEAIRSGGLARLLEETGLKLAAVGTGAGWLLRKLTLTHADRAVRLQATDFIRDMIDVGGALGAPAIIGSMQGRWHDNVDRKSALAWLAEALEDLGEHARRFELPLVFEPINRYETNLVNSVADGVELIESLSTTNVRLLCDLFHMNIEETDLAQALRQCGKHLGHVHFVDSNRRPAGLGHIDYAPIAQALAELRYSGYLSAEALSFPDARAAAAQTFATYRRFFAK